MVHCNWNARKGGVVGDALGFEQAARRFDVRVNRVHGTVVDENVKAVL